MADVLHNFYFIRFEIYYLVIHRFLYLLIRSSLEEAETDIEMLEVRLEKV